MKEIINRIEATEKLLTAFAKAQDEQKLKMEYETRVRNAEIKEIRGLVQEMVLKAQNSPKSDRISNNSPISIAVEFEEKVDKVIYDFQGHEFTRKIYLLMEEYGIKSVNVKK